MKPLHPLNPLNPLHPINKDLTLKYPHVKLISSKRNCLNNRKLDKTNLPKPASRPEVLNEDFHPLVH